MKFFHTFILSSLLCFALNADVTVADSQTSGGNEGGAPFKSEAVTGEKGEENLRRLLPLLRDPKLLEITPCGTSVKISQDDLSSIYDDLWDGAISHFPPQFSAVFKEQFREKQKYGFEMRKVCASCDEVLKMEPDFKTRYDNSAFEKYCGEGVYGSDLQVSGLVVLPLKGNEILPGELPGFIFSRYTTVPIIEIPSQFETSLVIPYQILGVMATISEGTVSICPDFVGYGSSQAPRGFLLKDPYPASTIPLWLKTKVQLREETNCNTDIGNSATYAGYSEGGYATIAIADGLQKAIGVQPNFVLAGGGPIRMKDMMLRDIIKNNIGPENLHIGLLFGLAYSSTYPTVANFNAGQDLLRSEVRDLVLGWLQEVDITHAKLNEKILSFLGGSADGFIDAIINPNILSLVRGAIGAGNEDYCQSEYDGYETGVHDKICAALIQNDLHDTILEVDYPVRLCHSSNDELVSMDHLANVTENPFVELKLAQGDHRLAGGECLADVGLFIAHGLSSVTPEPSPISCPEKSPTPAPSNDLNQEFLFKKKRGVLETKKCSFIGTQSPSEQERICTAREYQIRSKRNGYAPASVACFDSCSGFCAKEFGRSRFLYKRKMKNEVVIEKSKSCRWLEKQEPSKIAKICSALFDGSLLYGSAADVCTTVCATC